MGSEWPRVQISEVCELIVDCVNKTAPISAEVTPYKMIRTPNIKNGRVTTDDCRYVTEETFVKWTRRATVERNDVLLTREAPLGEVGIVNTSEKVFLGQRVMQYRADLKKLDPHFLLYSFLSPDLQHQFSMHEGSGSVVSHIRVGDCSKFFLNLPSLSVQKKVVEILKNLDAKIELNRQINQTLEQMAQALFKSWFVDFDPVIDNALAAGNPIPDELQDRAALRQALRESDTAGQYQPLPESVRALFPDGFEESELGWVPKGWGVESLSDISKVTSGKRPPSKSDVKTEKEHIPVWGGNGIKWYTTESLYNSKYIITGRVGTLGTVYKVSGESWASDNALVLHPKSDDYFELVFQSLRSFDMTSLNSGSTQPLITQTALKGIQILLPNNNAIFSKFQVMAVSFDEKTKSNDQEVESLSNLRDTLLPKLISGELQLDQLPDAVTSVV